MPTRAATSLSSPLSAPPATTFRQSLKRVLELRTKQSKDFGLLAYAGGHRTAGVIQIRFPGDARSSLGQAVVNVVTEFGDRLSKAFVVIEPETGRRSAHIY